MRLQQQESGAEPVPGGAAAISGSGQMFDPTATYGHDKSGRYSILSTMPAARKAFEEFHSSFIKTSRHHGMVVVSLCF